MTAKPFKLLTNIKGADTVYLVEYDYNHKAFKNKKLTLLEVIDTLNSLWETNSELRDLINKFFEEYEDL